MSDFQNALTTIYVYVVQRDEFRPDPDDELGFRRIHSIHTTLSGANKVGEELTTTILRKEKGSKVKDRHLDPEGKYYAYIKLYKDRLFWHREEHHVVTVGKWAVDDTSKADAQTAQVAGFRRAQQERNKRRKM